MFQTDIFAADGVDRFRFRSGRAGSNLWPLSQNPVFYARPPSKLNIMQARLERFQTLT